MDKERIVRDEASGSFILLRYKDAREVLGDNTLWKDPDKAHEEAVLLKSFKPRGLSTEDYNSSMLWLDGAAHARVRGPFAKAFLQRLASSRSTIESIIERQLSALAGRTSFDAI